MASAELHTVSIGCEADGYPEWGNVCPASIDLEFGRIEEDHVSVYTRLRIRDTEFGAGRNHYGNDILRFAEELTELHHRTDGSARLFDWDGETVICLTVIQRARGRIAIGGQIVPAVFNTEVMSADHFINPPVYGWNAGIRISFDGLVTDQSYLPPVIVGLRRFLTDTGISVRNPME